MSDPLRAFHPAIRSWFLERYGEPTDVQREAWPAISAGHHVLATAPTGSGKTLTAFLWAIDRLCTGDWTGGVIRVLYVSPLRALANDIRRNLSEPLAGVSNHLAGAGGSVAAVRVAIRTGDTPASERRRFLRHPPEILITTPESLNILLTSPASARLFRGLKTVILDEIHAVAGNKRGTHLITAVERLVRVAGEFQRIALSATVRPLDRMAEWIGGWTLSAGAYRRRPLVLVAPRSSKILDVQVRAPSVDPLAAGTDRQSAPASHPTVWHAIADRIAARLETSRSTIIFGNGRRVVERLSRLINDRTGRQTVYSHHGSLSREIREAVEERLKKGELAGIVATSSLELGIDVGAVDEVVLVGTPPSIASALQRIGRAGHRVREVSRGVLYPCHALDLLLSAVVTRGILDGDVEPIRPLSAPLDVLAQVILSMVSVERWSLDDLYSFFRTCDAYHDLSRKLFDLVVDMLAGRYQGSRIHALKPRIALDRVEGSVSILPGGALLATTSGGTIPDRGYFKLRLCGAGAKSSVIGELDEEFVWERSEGDTFTLGVQMWRIERITHNDVFVVPASGRLGMAAFWRGDERDLPSHLAEAVARFLECAEGALDSPGFRSELGQRYRLDATSADRLIRYLEEQRAMTGAPLPHRHHIVVERAPDRLVILHTFWGGRVNRPLAVALASAWRQRNREDLRCIHDDACVVVELPESAGRFDLFDLVRAENVNALLEANLESTGFFGARFRENAGRALLLPRGRFGRRTPLWQSRLRAKELREAVSGYGDFPILLETWRTCLCDEMDVDRLKSLLDGLLTGQIAISEVDTRTPSPFSRDALWKRTNMFVYADDSAEGTSRLSGNLIREVALSSETRPLIEPSLVEELRRKIQRIEGGYSPQDSGELVEWVKERVLISGEEWLELLGAVARDHGLSKKALFSGVSSRVVAVRPKSATGFLVCSVENLESVVASLGLGEDDGPFSALLDGSSVSDEAGRALRTLAQRKPEGSAEPSADLPGLLGDWLRYLGPMPVDRISQTLGVEVCDLQEAAEVLSDEGRCVVGKITTGADPVELCDVDNLERLLRRVRAKGRSPFGPVPARLLPLFLAEQQGLGRRATASSDVVMDLQACLDTLLGYPAPAEMWETDILPARLDPYRSEWLDDLLAGSDLRWIGSGPQQITFMLESELGLGRSRDSRDPEEGSRDVDRIFPAPFGRFTFAELSAHSRLASADLTRLLWKLVWSGLVSNDGFSVLRMAIANRFRPVEVSRAVSSTASRGGRVRFSRWRSSRPFAGAWYRLSPSVEPEDPIDRAELGRECARIVLDRYGIVFRELLSRERPDLRWNALVRTLQIMELSGEVVAGRFFEGVSGLQFALPAALDRLSAGLDEDRIFWMSAADPASLCGLAIEGLELPRRVSSTHLVYHGRRLVVVSARRGSILDIRVDSDDPRLFDYLEFLAVRLGCEESPIRAVVVETINGCPAPVSPYRPVLQQMFHVDGDDRTLRVSRRLAPTGRANSGDAATPVGCPTEGSGP